MSKVHEVFFNELNNEITLSTEKKQISGVPGVMIYIAGPTSDTTNHITMVEAEKLHAQLSKVLNK
jgi:uncharacterized phage protein gp47/JayE